VAHNAFVDDPVLFIGIIFLVGFTGSVILERYRVPHVVVYLLTGFVLGNSLFRDINLVEELSSWYLVSETLALGLIGFKIGTELKFKSLMKEPRFIIILLIAEAGAAMLLVTSVVYTYSGSFLMSIIMGGLATATAPAATVEVLRQVKAEGPLTTRIQWILALDDLIAITVIEAVLVYVSVSLGGSLTISRYFITLFKEIFLAVLLGVGIGLMLDNAIESMEDELKMMEITLGVVMFSLGLAHFMGTSVITTAMTIGATVTNRSGDNYEKASDLLEILMSPILMIFFVFVGARIHISQFDVFPILALLYLTARTIGKLVGAYYGAKIGEADDLISKNIGFGLLSQGGVTLGLVTLIGEILVENGYDDMANKIIKSLIISTVFSVILGSMGTKFAMIRSGEIGKAKLDIRHQPILNSKTGDSTISN
jgi:Kef-type K+ transport system membrane component KefB